MTKKSISLIILPIVALLLAFLLPVNYEKVQIAGTDSFKTHAILSGERVAEDWLAVAAGTTEIGFLVVPLTGSEHLPADVVLRLGNEEIRSAIDPQNLSDDKFSWVSLNGQLEEEAEVGVVLSAKEAPSQQALGVRFDEETGRLAYAVRQRVPFWQRALLWRQDNPDEGQELSEIFLLLVGILPVFFLLDFLESKKKKIGWVVLALVFIVSVLVKIPVALRIDSFFGGDAMNYYLKGVDWLAAKDPFSSDARKGPFWTALLLPGLAPFVDPLWWGRVVNIVVTSLGSVLLALIMREFKLRWSLSAAAALLLTVNRNWIFESVHTLANPSFAVLILLAFYLLWKNRVYLLSAVAALATLNRYEGFLGYWFLLCAWLGNISWQKRLRSLVPAGIILAIPFLAWPFTGKIGVRTAGDIAADQGLGLAHSWDDFLNNSTRLRLYFGRQWHLQELAGDQWQALLAGLLIGAVLVLAAKKLSHFSWVPVTLMFSASTVSLFAVGHDSVELWRNLMMLLTFLAGLGAGQLAASYPKKIIPLFVLLIALAIVITTILPKDRYWLPLLPFLVMSLVYPLKAKGRQVLFSSIAAAVLLSFAYVNSQVPLSGAIGEYNTKSASQTVLYRAAKEVAKKNGTVVTTREDLSLRVYVGDERLEKISRDKILESSQDFLIDNGLPQEIPGYEVVQTWNSEDEDATLYKKIQLTYEN